MKRVFILGLKIFGGLVALILVLLAAIFFYINSNAGQQRLLKFATDLLQEKLETKVQIDSVSVNFGTSHRIVLPDRCKCLSRETAWPTSSL